MVQGRVRVVRHRPEVAEVIVKHAINRPARALPGVAGSVVYHDNDCLNSPWKGNMLLVFTFVYIFQGFQTHATDLFAESVVSACVCHRSIWDTLWSCLATIFAGLWISVHPNIPLPNEAGWRVFLRRLELMFWAILGPELVIVWAFRQWLGARELEKLYKGEVSDTIHSDVSAYIIMEF